MVSSTSRVRRTLAGVSLLLVALAMVFGSAHAANLPLVHVKGEECLLTRPSTTECAAVLQRAFRILRTPNGMYPNVVYIKAGGTETGRSCAAVLLNSEWALTVAHCLRDDRDMPRTGIIYYEAKDLEARVSHTDLTKAERVLFDKVIFDPWLDASKRVALRDGLALLHLASPLPVPDAMFAESVPAAAASAPGNATLVGWGRLFYGEADESRVGYPPDHPNLRYQRSLPVEILSRAECEHAQRGSTAPENGVPGLVCARSRFYAFEGCRGFAGSPLLVPSRDPKGGNQEAVLALSSSTPSRSAVCLGEKSDERVPVYYTPIAPYREWIDSVVHRRQAGFAGPMRLAARPPILAVMPGPLRKAAVVTSLDRIGFAALSSISLSLISQGSAQGAVVDEPEPNTNVEGGYPYVVSIGLADQEVTMWAHRCGGVIVGHRWVLTAAHCVDKYASNPEKLSVFAEEDLLRTAPRPKVDAIHIYESRDERFQYTRFNTTIHDLALIRLQHNFSGDRSEWALKTLDAAEEQRLVASNDGLLIGWGARGFDESSPPIQRRPKHLFMPILANDRCNTLPLRKGLIFPGMMCAGDAYHDSCQGDSGGPLIIFDRGQARLLGVSSWGFGCAANDRAPGVYTRASYYRNWISNVVSNDIDCGDGHWDKLSDGTIQRVCTRNGRPFCQQKDGDRIVDVNCAT